MKNHVYVSVPASSGNMGPGFDVLGMALDLRNKMWIRMKGKKPGPPKLLIRGEGEGDLPTNTSNIIYHAIQTVFLQAKKRMGQLEIVCENKIPLARGLGSSAAAYVSGLIGANTMLGNPFDKFQILKWASKFEGHPDNAAPALYGGVRATVSMNGDMMSIAWPVPKCQLVLVIPDFKLSTKTARQRLPNQVSMKDAVHNMASVALMQTAFSKDLKMLSQLLNDRLHEPYRADLIPGFHDVKKAALKAGAYGVTLSGAGPSLLAFVPRQSASSVANAMKKTFAYCHVKSKSMNINIDKKGALVR